MVYQDMYEQERRIKTTGEGVITVRLHRTLEKGCKVREGKWGSSW